jgi:hypothetical protein
MNKYKLLFSFLLLALIGIVFLVYPKTSIAKPSYFVISGTNSFPATGLSAGATTSPLYLTDMTNDSVHNSPNATGTATSTLTFDAQAAPSGAQALDSAILAVQFTGSSTAAILNIAIERSQDCIDFGGDYLNADATTTQANWLDPLNLGTALSYQLTYASTTYGGQQLRATSTPFTVLLKIPTPTRCTRAVFTLASSTAANIRNGAVWAQFIGKRENN